MKIVLFLFSLFLILFFPFQTLATDSNNQFVTIVNPVRVSRYTHDLKSSVEAQYEQIQKRSLPATWLLTFDVLERKDVTEFFSGIDKSQELGIFLEVTPDFALKSDVEYNKTDSWHRAHALFLSGYTQDDRKKLIDTVFEKFKQTFKSYPKSVGAWWIDSYSLEYMQSKYGISANLGLADQFTTDGYSVWGQFWSAPFIPSKYHAGIPANNLDHKLNIVTIEWAFRDPLNGYGSSPANNYSTQDYLTINLTNDYFSKFLDLYTSKGFNKFSQTTIGLESDLDPPSYMGGYADQLDVAKRKNVQFLTMSDFAKWYLNNFSLTPPDTIVSDDLLGTQKKVIWYQSSHYRIGIKFDGSTNQTEIFDFRIYPGDFEEPNYLSPNKQLNLYISLPFLIDKTSDPNSGWIISKNKLTQIIKNGDGLILKFGLQEAKFSEGNITLQNIDSIPASLKASPLISISGLTSTKTITPVTKYIFPKEGLVFRGLSIKATYFLNRPKIQILLRVGVLMTISVFFLLLFLNFNTYLRLIILRSFLVLLIGGGGTLFYLNSQIYQVSQSEVDALLHLQALPFGNVVVPDNGCLICSYHTKFPPPFFANNRSYVQLLSKKPVVYNSKIFTTSSRSEGRKQLKNVGAKYIYVSKFEDYIETLPFSPGDYFVDLIYENANAQIWKIRDHAPL